MLPDVVSKLIKSKTQALCLVPKDMDQEWYRNLSQFADREPINIPVFGEVLISFLDDPAEFSRYSTKYDYSLFSINTADGQISKKFLSKPLG